MKKTKIVLIALLVLFFACSMPIANACRLVGIVAPGTGMNINAYNEVMTGLKAASDNYGEDGWGMYYVQPSPETYNISRSSVKADDDVSFPPNYIDVGPLKIVLAHVRAATTIPVSGSNDPHPFIYDLYGKKTAFEHNGTLGTSKEFFGKIRDKIGPFWHLDIMDREWRGSELDSTGFNDSELFGMIMNRNYMIAMNYNLPKIWAVDRTMKDLDEISIVYNGYTSQNFMFTDSEDMFAMEKYQSSPSQFYFDLRYKVDQGTFTVFSHDVLDGYNNIANRTLIEVNNDALYTLHTDYGDRLSNLVDPTYIYANENAAGSQDYVSIGRCEDDESFAAVWEDGGGVTARWYNQMGLAEHPEIFLDPDLLFNGEYTSFSKPDVSPRCTYYSDLIGGTWVTTKYKRMEVVFRAYDGDGGYNICRVLCSLIGDERTWSVTSELEVTNNHDLCDNPRIAGKTYMLSANENTERLQLIVWQERASSNDHWAIKGRAFCGSNDTGVIPMRQTFWLDPWNENADYCNPEVEFKRGSLQTFIVTWVNTAPSEAFVEYTMWTLSDNLPAYREEIFDLYNEGSGNSSMTYPRIGASYDEADDYFTITFQDYTASTTGKIYARTYLNNYSNGTDASLTLTASESIEVDLRYSTSFLYPDIDGRSGVDWDIVYSSYVTGAYRNIKLIKKRGSTINTSTIYDGSYSYRPCIATFDVDNFPERRLAMWYSSSVDGSSYGILGDFDPPILSSSAAKQAPGNTAFNKTLPCEYVLEPVYPNPFNATTNVRFSLPEAGDVTFCAFNVQGRQVMEVVRSGMSAGNHVMTVDANSWASGVYFIQMRAGGTVLTRKALLIK